MGAFLPNFSPIEKIEEIRGNSSKIYMATHDKKGQLARLVA